MNDYSDGIKGRDLLCHRLNLGLTVAHQDFCFGMILVIAMDKNPEMKNVGISPFTIGKSILTDIPECPNL